MRWRGLEPPRGINPTRPSTLRVYQFRHQRAAAILAAARRNRLAAEPGFARLSSRPHAGKTVLTRREVVMPAKRADFVTLFRHQRAAAILAATREALVAAPFL